MKRRTFFKALLAIASAPYIRKLPGAKKVRTYAEPRSFIQMGELVLPWDGKPPTVM